MNTNVETQPQRIKWEKESDLGFFRRYDGTYIYEPVSLGNHALRRILERHFEFMSRNLYFISAFGRFILGFGKDEAVVQAEDIATRTLSKAIKNMSRRIEQAEALISANGIKVSAQNGRTENIELPITTPGAMMYANLLVKADHFYNLNALLWLNGEIDNKAKFANESEARKEIQGVIRGVAAQFGYILNKTREKDANEAKRAGEHDESKLVKDAIEEVDQASSQSMTGNVEQVASSSSSDAAPSADTKKTKKSQKTEKSEAQPAEA